MIWRSDADLRRDRAKLADPCIGDHAAGTEIGGIAEVGIFDGNITERFAATADGHLAQFDRRIDDCFSELRAQWSRLVHVDWSSLIRRRRGAVRRHVSWRAGGRECAFGLVTMRRTRAYAARTSNRNRLTWPARSRDCEESCS